MNDMLKLSVIMPVYKERLDHLKSSIDGVLNQTYDNFEFIIVAEPNEENITFLDNIKKSDSRTKVIRNKTRLGVADTRNRAINKCTGEYIAFVDADDFSRVDRFEKQVEFLEDNPEISVLGSNMDIVDENDNIIGKRKYPELHEDILREFLLIMPLANPTVMVRNKDLKDLGTFNSTLIKSEDFDLWMRFLAYNRRFHNVQEDLISYRVTAGYNEKRPKIHWVNNYIARKKYGKYIWPLHQRMLSLSAYYLISLISETYLNALLSLPLVDHIKKIKRY